MTTLEKYLTIVLLFALYVLGVAGVALLAAVGYRVARFVWRLVL